MANSSLIGIPRAAKPPPGHSGEALGPSDSSDSGSDTAGTPHGSDAAGTDSAGTGERRSAGDDETQREARDIAPDRVVSTRERDIGDAIEADEDADLSSIDTARADALPDGDLPGEDRPGEDEPDDDKPGEPRRDNDKPVSVLAR
jgi:hypothetical protein